jgi:hypothetical protein
METVLWIVVIAGCALGVEVYVATGEIVTELRAIQRELRPTHHPVELAGITLTSDRNLADELIAAIQQLEKAVVRAK